MKILPRYAYSPVSILRNLTFSVDIFGYNVRETLGKDEKIWECGSASRKMRNSFVDFRWGVLSSINQDPRAFRSSKNVKPFRSSISSACVSGSSLSSDNSSSSSECNRNREASSLSSSSYSTDIDDEHRLSTTHRKNYKKLWSYLSFCCVESWAIQTFLPRSVELSSWQTSSPLLSSWI